MHPLALLPHDPVLQSSCELAIVLLLPQMGKLRLGELLDLWALLGWGRLLARNPLGKGGVEPSSAPHEGPAQSVTDL